MWPPSAVLASSRSLRGGCRAGRRDGRRGNPVRNAMRVFTGLRAVAGSLPARGGQASSRFRGTPRDDAEEVALILSPHLFFSAVRRAT